MNQLPVHESLQLALEEASRLEKKHDWEGATRSYNEAIASLEDLTLLGSLHEKRAYALYKTAMQRDSSSGFKDLMGQAVSNYRKCLAIYQDTRNGSAEALSLRCRAMINYARFWIVSQGSRARPIKEAWKYTKKALELLERSENGAEHVATFNQLSLVPDLALAYVWKLRVRKEGLREVANHGREAVKFASARSDPDEIAQTFARTAILLWRLGNSDEKGSAEYEESCLEAKSLWQKALKESEAQAILQLSNSCYSVSIDWTPASEEGVRLYDRVVAEALKTKDNLLIGCAFDLLAVREVWRTNNREDEDTSSSLLDQALEHAEKSASHFRPMSFASFRFGPMWEGAPLAEYYYLKAAYEPDLKRKRRLIEQAERSLSELMGRALSTRLPFVLASAHHVHSKVLAFMAQLEKRAEQKRNILQMALQHRLDERRYPIEMNYGNAISLGYLAEIKLELSKLAKTKPERRRLLREAIADYEMCAETSTKIATLYEAEGDTSHFRPLGHRQIEIAKSLSSLYQLTGDISVLDRSAQACVTAASSFEKSGMVTGTAECFWRAAQLLDVLGEHERSAENFSQASKQYKVAAEKVPRLTDFCSQLSSYMEAWTNIEEAKYYHAREEYQAAKEHYTLAAELHKSTGRWNSFAPSYAAWAEVEDAEDLSRREQSEASIEAFKQARETFQESKIVLKGAAGRMEASDEREMAERLVEASNHRQEYCSARILIEQARLFDREGDYQQSAQKYRLATGTLEEISKALRSKSDRREFDFIKTISQAWEMMARAEAEANSRLFTQASVKFAKAKKLAPSQKARLLVLGHFRFSRALAGATGFMDTGNSRLFRQTAQHLQSAGDYYLRAGLHNATEYVKATRLLLDAYMQLGDARKERDQEKRARSFAVAEKILEGSATSYLKAGQPEKKRLVVRLAQKARDDRELATSLAQLLYAPLLTGTTATLGVPMPTQEEAVGFQRFEHADIRANLLVDQKDLRIGDKLSVKIELVNAGRNLAQLVKIDDAVPRGFEMTTRPGDCIVKGSSLDMKGKRLGSLQTEDLEFQLRAIAQGFVPLSPRILYLDESGEYRSCKLEPVEIIVGEPYIPEWMRGPGEIRVPPEFRFETERARQVFQHLVKAFWEDYVSKGLVAENAGWRSLMKLIQASGLPRSVLYGPQGRKGSVLAELDRLGLVELRVFPEQRGRGGTITKARLAFSSVVLKNASQENRFSS